MSSEQLEEGKRWINSTLLKLATDSAVTIDRAEWCRDADDARGGTETLVVEVKGQRFFERFRLAHLEDIPGDSGVRMGVEDCLAKLIARMLSSPGHQA